MPRGTAAEVYATTERRSDPCWLARSAAPNRRVRGLCGYPGAGITAGGRHLGRPLATCQPTLSRYHQGRDAGL